MNGRGASGSSNSAKRKLKARGLCKHKPPHTWPRPGTRTESRGGGGNERGTDIDPKGNSLTFPLPCTFIHWFFQRRVPLCRSPPFGREGGGEGGGGGRASLFLVLFTTSPTPAPPMRLATPLSLSRKGKRLRSNCPV